MLKESIYRANWMLSTFFQIDLEVIRIMRSKYFSLGFAENISKFMILGRDIRKVRSLSQIRYSLVVILELNSVSGVQYKDMMIDR